MLDNINKYSHRINKHVELWAKNAFNNWQKYDIEKSIANLSTNNKLIKDFVEMLFLFVL
jgi:hypothetical protein